MNITEFDYNTEINAIATNMVAEIMAETDNNKEEALEVINDYRLHETIDGHQWVIYYAYNLDVIQHSKNDEYMTDNFGNEEAGTILAEKGLNSLHTAIAFWAMYADVSELIEDKIGEYMDTLETE